MRPLRILLLSSRPIDHSANLAQDHYDALTSAGHIVDFNYPGMDDDIAKAKLNLYNYPKWFSVLAKIHFVGALNRLGFYFKIQRKAFMIHKTWRTGNGDEKHPLLDPHLILNNIRDRQYDLIYTLFWENIISSETLKILYEFYKCLIIIGSVDMAPMTGGCFYFGSCQEYANECRHCPMFRYSIWKYAHKNFLTKRSNYNSIELIYACNTHQKLFAERTGLFKFIKTKSTLISDKIFHLQSRNSCLDTLNINSNKSFIISARHSYEERKGFHIVKKCLEYLYNKISNEEAGKILLIIVGCKSELNPKEFPFDILNTGVVDSFTLAKVYSASNVFLCPSIDDAGPSMINQSMMCGTPVISFNSGTAIDVVEDGVSGYKVNIGDIIGFAERLYRLYCLSDSQYKLLRETTYQTSKKWNSSESYVKFVEDCYNLFREDGSKKEKQ